MTKALKERWLIVAARRLLTREAAHRQRWEGLRSLQDPALGPKVHCRQCCLPLDKHVEHEPPDCPPKPREVHSPTDEAWQAWHKAFTGWYQTALGALTDEELLVMPLPTHGIRLWVIAEELQR